MFMWIAATIGVIWFNVQDSQRRDDPGTRVKHPDYEMSAIFTAIEEYKAAFGELPGPNNRTISRSLRGQNPQKMVFLVGPPTSFSREGDFLDTWGTPFKLYFSSNQIIMRSAGPNKHFDDTGDKDFDDVIRTMVVSTN
jgi:hypothetical protein